jgi:hypothetical protein
MDTDILCQYSTEQVWKLMSAVDQAVVTVGTNYSPHWNFGFNYEVSENLGKNVPETHTGIIFFNRNHKDFNNYFELLPKIYVDYETYKLRRLFRGGRADEPIFAVANAIFEYKVLEFSETPIITFNYEDSVELPSKLQTFGHSINYENRKELDNYITFIHMFKPYRNEYFKILNKLLYMK